MKDLKFPKLEKMNFPNKQEAGYFCERWAAKYLRQKFGLMVVRTDKGMSPFDLLGFANDRLWLVQVRSGSCWKWGKQKELDAMLAFPAPPYCRKLIIRIDAFDNEPHLRDLNDKTKNWWVRKSKEQWKQIKDFRAQNKNRKCNGEKEA